MIGTGPTVTPKTYEPADDDSRDPFEFGSIPEWRGRMRLGAPAARTKSTGPRRAPPAQKPTTDSSKVTRKQANDMVTRSASVNAYRATPSDRRVRAAIVRWLRLNPQGATVDCQDALRFQGLVAPATMIKFERKKILANQELKKIQRSNTTSPRLKRKLMPDKPARRIRIGAGTTVRPVERPRSGPKDDDRCQACDLVPTREGYCRCG